MLRGLVIRRAAQDMKKAEKSPGKRLYKALLVTLKVIPMMRVLWS